jgi:hypothetical protein
VAMKRRRPPQVEQARTSTAKLRVVDCHPHARPFCHQRPHDENRQQRSIDSGQMFRDSIRGGRRLPAGLQYTLRLQRGTSCPCGPRIRSGRLGTLLLRPPASYAGSRTSRVVSVSVHLDGVIMRISANP